MAKMTIKLLGEPIQNEDDKAAEVITPGHLIVHNGSGDWIKHATAGGNTARTFAMEREEMGAGIDVNYAIGDTVKAGTFAPGDRVLAFAASGQNLTKGNKMESAGNGTLRVLAAGTPLATILETTGLLAALTRIRVEIM